MKGINRPVSFSVGLTLLVHRSRRLRQTPRLLSFSDRTIAQSQILVNMPAAVEPSLTERNREVFQ